jgi:hypothetical protein
VTGGVHWPLSVCVVSDRFGPIPNPNIWADIAGTSCARCPSAHACRCLTAKTRDGARRSRRAWRAFHWFAGARTAGTWSPCPSFRCGGNGVCHWPDIARSGVTVTQLLCFRYHSKCTEVPHGAKCGRHFHLSFQYKMYQRVPPTFCRVRYSGSGYCVIAGHPWRALYSIPPNHDTGVLRVSLSITCQISGDFWCSGYRYIPMVLKDPDKIMPFQTLRYLISSETSGSL